MVHCLCQEFLYSEKRPRDWLFRAMEEVILDSDQEAGPLIVAKLSRDAGQRARLSAASSNLELSHWQTASKAVINAMLAAGVLLSNGEKEITPGITAQATEVVALKPDYTEATEMYLLEFLIRRM